MGETIPPEEPDRPKGPDCLACWAAGETPDKIYVLFENVELCPGASWPGGVDLNQLWELDRHDFPAKPCSWEYLDANWRIIYFAEDVGSSYLWAFNIIGHQYFHDTHAGVACDVLFTNDRACIGIGRGNKGTGTIS